MSSESYLARWGAYLNSFNKSVLAETAEADKTPTKETEFDGLIEEPAELERKLIDS